MLDNLLRNDLNIEHTVLEVPTTVVAARTAIVGILNASSYASSPFGEVTGWYFDGAKKAFNAMAQIQQADNEIPYRLLTHTREDIIFVWNWEETFEERHMRISKVQIAYYRQHPMTATENDYITWLDGLEGALKNHMVDKGFESCKTVLAFQRFYFEFRHDHGMNAYMQSNLSKEDFDFWNS